MENTTFTTDVPQNKGTSMATTKKAKPAAKKTRNAARPVIIQTEEELAKIGHRCPELLTTSDGAQRLKLYEQAQKALPPKRRRPHNSLYMACVYEPKYMEGTLEKMRVAMDKYPAPPPKKKTGTKPGTKLQRWDFKTTALIAYDTEVLALISDPNHNPTYEKLLEATLHAQARQLDPDDRRPRQSILNAMYNGNSHLRRLRNALLHPAPTNLKAMPMHAHSIVEPEPEPLEQVEHVEQVAPVAPPPLPAHPLADALAVIAQALGPALTRMLSHVTTQVVRSVIAELKEPAPKPADAPTTEQISEAVRKTVIDILGAPQPAPEAQAEAEPEPAPPATATPIEVPKAKIARVDVVGLLSVQQQAVRKRCGTMFDLRFIAADDVGHADLGATTVVCTKFVSHDAQERAKAKGSRVLYANGGAQSVVKRLRELAVSEP